ncbi:hypothetical protein PR003_g31653 [Phytophthora rubi]|uniref:Uncharacterized protein n=1 Tax=Phytophthora rubi TaxID=129364 RepID=A0A6A4B2B8_9STRA|nr:hypothetical protein PR001_g32917 [Phytophthora rubi]KAE8953391.1 hypothetical protein PR002_g32401 [Phytophthora rubi]KAE9267813.1 hypothetical protein PR003_g31653 [Phytophthora rubi]
MEQKLAEDEEEPREKKEKVSSVHTGMGVKKVVHCINGAKA